MLRGPSDRAVAGQKGQDGRDKSAPSGYTGANAKL